MDQLEKVEKIREKTGVSYEDAKTALTENDGDILDAIIWLEQKGKVAAPETPVFTTGPEQASSQFEEANKTYEDSCQGVSFGDMVHKFFRWCGKIFRKGCETSFEVTRNKEKILSMPVIAFVLLLVFAFWVVIPLLVIGLFCDCKYRFNGIEKTEVDLNDICEKASETCEEIKKDFMNEQ